jgi:hypothetical protein
MRVATYNACLANKFSFKHEQSFTGGSATASKEVGLRRFNENSEREYVKNFHENYSVMTSFSSFLVGPEYGFVIFEHS